MHIFDCAPQCANQLALCLKSNVALSAPILSRFDLFFVVLDECNTEADNQVARHILKVHRCEEESVKPPFSTEQMRRYIRLAKTINPKMTPESQRILVDCYRKLRQGDTLGRSRSAYRITVRQLESMIRLSEAMARLHCDNEIQPSYVREAFRLLRTSIVQVETSGVEMEGEDDPIEEVHEADEEGDTQETETNADFNPETQIRAHPGEYGSEDMHGSPSNAKKMAESRERESRKKTKISFEEYESITNAIATHLRALESDGDDQQSRHMKWKDVVEWYVEQMENDIGDSLEMLEQLRKKINLVIRRLVNVDLVLVILGDPPANKREEQEAVLAVHPNYVSS
jgi:DNA replication licensing factor MCM6